MLREYSMKQGMEQINYTNFASDLYRIRFELMDSRIMDINLKIIDKVVIDSCDLVSENKKTVTLKEMQAILCGSKQLTLTPFQVFMLLGFTKPDKEANVDYKAFASVCAEKISAMYKIEAMRRKSQLVAVGQFRKSDVRMPTIKDGVVFAAFR